MTAPDPTAGEREPYCTACLFTDRQCEEANGGCCDVCRATGGCSHTTEPAPASPPAVAASTGTSEDAEALGLLALLTAHRPNVVTEPYCDPETGDQFRTRVKCDGDTCNFYREGPRYWSVMDEHTAHLASLLAAREAAARAEAWYQGAQAATDWIKGGGWLATMPENPYE